LSRFEFKDIRNGAGVFQGFIPVRDAGEYSGVPIAQAGAGLLYSRAPATENMA